jgi:chromosome segregation ATPase
MNDNPQEQLADALKQAGPLASLTALRAAVAWSQRALSAEVGQDAAIAFRCIAGLDDSLSDLGRLLDLVPGIVSVVSPGQTVLDRIADRRTLLEKQQAALRSERAAIAAAGDLDRQLKEAEAERDQLSARIQMLERQHLLAAELPALQTRLSTAQEAVDSATAAAANQVAGGLVAAAGQLTDLTEQQRALLGPELARLIDEAAAATAALADETQRRDEVTAELDRRRGEAEALQGELQDKLASLEEHRQADQDVADGLTKAGLPARASSVERVQVASGEIAQRLSDLDSMLRPLLDEQARVYFDDREIRPYAG